MKAFTCPQLALGYPPKCIHPESVKEGFPDRQANIVKICLGKTDLCVFRKSDTQMEL
jgi:hypothetical protein